MRKGDKIKPKPLQSVRAPAVPTLLAGARGSWGSEESGQPSPRTSLGMKLRTECVL